MKKLVGTFVKTALPIGLGVYLFWYFFSSMSDEHILSFKKAFREANYFWVILAMLLEFISLWSRAYRWKYLLEPMGYRSSWANRYHAMMIGYLANYTLPRAGEPTRSAMLFRSDGIPFAKSFGTILAERAVDVLMLAFILGLTLLFGHKELLDLWNTIPQQFASDNNTTTNSANISQVTSILLISLVMIALVLLFFNKTLRQKVNGFMRGLIDGILSIFKTDHAMAFIVHTLLIWLCWVLMFIVPFYALSETSHVPFSGMLIGFIVGTLGMSLTNGGIGVYPLLVGFVVAFYLEPDYHDQAKGIGNALGMIIWLGNTAIMILLGLISLVLLPKNYNKNTENDNTIRKSAQ